MRFSPLFALPPAMALTCSPGLYVLVARGTFELPGAGIFGLIPKTLAERTSANITTAPIDYPASLSKPGYTESVKAGGQAVHDAIDEYASACPDGKMAVGAQISMDAICGGAGDGFPPRDALPSEKLDNVVAIALFGDPTHVANTTYDRGTSIKNGIFTRDAKSLAVCNKYSSRIVSYCDTGDVYCDTGDIRPVHANYLNRYTDETVSFILDRFQAASNSSSSAPPTSASSSASVTSATPSSSSLSLSSSAASATLSSGPAPSRSDVPVVSLACANRAAVLYLGSVAAIVAAVLSRC
ncbi:hypothetical protein CDD81_3424 [Ophiocordyceps australis]|uniref:Cutinase n=1 Tax=Ophiocordyceps australis TaxID=1399860 RepID=A0A2C5YBE1_9HYPO|nr:hypothetical protein CDD81_3424 [Ophiocordyceps australis]